MEVILEFLSKGLVTMLFIAMPCVLVAAVIGLVVGVLQAVTQVQEQTIAAAPKILGVFLVILVFGVGFIKMLTNLFYEGRDLAFNGITKSGNFVLGVDEGRFTALSTELYGGGSFKNKPTINKIMKNPDKVPFIDNNERIKYFPSNRGPNPQPDFVEKKEILEK